MVGASVSAASGDWLPDCTRRESAQFLWYLCDRHLCSGILESPDRSRKLDLVYTPVEHCDRVAVMNKSLHDSRAYESRSADQKNAHQIRLKSAPMAEE
jgi:hypothetical protein